MTEPTQRPGSPGRFAELATDVVGLAGGALVTYGVSLISRPWAFIIGGAFLLLGAWLLGRKGGA